MLIATAGHVDHGKTALIRALTGVDTDRLPEERARGISIDLGFAYWRPDEGGTIGFVDVPGHRRYLRNMLAGVSGLHFALLAVAADDGVMPQTIEHLRILDLLGLPGGLVAITKCDKASASRIAQVRGEVADLLAGTALEGAAMFNTSAQTGEGVAELGQALISARDHARTELDKDHGFRMAIDRVFSVAGAGTVATGLVTAGRARVGETVVLAPHGRELRLRGLQSGGETVDTIAAGHRCAANLAGIEVAELGRGDWLVTPGLNTSSTRIDCMVKLLAEGLALRHGARVHWHHGAGDHAARVLLPGQRAVQPGGSGLAQLVLDTPACAVTGERFILRDAGGQVLLGGGQVLDPLPGTRRRRVALREQIASALALATPHAVLTALAAIPGFECDTGWFARCFNLLPEALRELLAGGEFVLAGSDDRLVLTRSRFEQLCGELVEALGRFHAAQPEAGGMTRRELRTVCGAPLSADLLACLLAHLGAEGRVDAGGQLVRLPGHAPSFAPAEVALWNIALDMLDGAGIRPIRLAELAAELGTGEATVRAMLYRRRLAGDVWQVTPRHYLLHRHLAHVAAIASRLDDAHTGFTAAQFRDASGLGRNFVIELLEFLDRIGVTRRAVEKRRMRAGFESIVGLAEGVPAAITG